MHRIDVPELQVHQLLIPEATFQSEQHAYSRVWFGCFQHRPGLIRRVDCGELVLTFWSRRYNLSVHPAES